MKKKTAGLDRLACIVLAAGKGTRMKSSKAKVLHTLLGAPLCTYPIDRARELGASPVVAVLGHQLAEVEQALVARYGAGAIPVVEQREQKGTGHAVKLGLAAAGGRNRAGADPLRRRAPPAARDHRGAGRGGPAHRRPGHPHRAAARPHRLRAHPARPAQARAAGGRGEGLQPQGEGDPGDQRRLLRRPHRFSAQGHRRPEDQQRAGRILPHRHRADGRPEHRRLHRGQRARGDRRHQRPPPADRRRAGDAPAGDRAVSPSTSPSAIPIRW